jgi:hypothetical protein
MVYIFAELLYFTAIDQASQAIGQVYPSVKQQSSHNDPDQKSNNKPHKTASTH